MSSLTDAELLAAYRTRRDRAALEHIVRRYIGFVYASALRQVRGRCAAHLADDITQAVFIVLTHKAAKIRGDVMLRDWLFVTTRYAAKNALRAEARRRHYEHVAAQRKVETVVTPDDSMLDELSPLLDEGIAGLSERDRRGVLLSFFDNKTFREIGGVLGVSEEAARKRVARAVDKLRRFFISRGVLIDSGTLSNNLHHIAATSIAPAALLSTTLSATGSTAAAISIAKGTGTVMTLIKFKSIAAIIAICCATGVTISAVALTNVGPSEAHAAPTTNPASGSPTIAVFPDGISVELLGVTHADENAGKWWTPNGAPTAEACDLGQAIRPWPSHQVCARVDKLPEGSSVIWKTTGNVWSDEPGKKSGTDVPGLFAILVGASQKHPLDITCKIACGEWVTLASCKATGSMCQPFDQGSVAFAPMYEQDGVLCASIAHDITGHQVRVQAIDSDGAAHPAIARVINSPGKLVQLNVSFDLPMDRVDKVELQIRPYDHVATFKGITLDPGNPSQVQVTTGDKE